MSDAFSYRVKGFYRRIPSEPHKLTELTTSTKDCIVLYHLGVLEVSDGDAWEFEIGRDGSSSGSLYGAADQGDAEDDGLVRASMRRQSAGSEQADASRLQCELGRCPTGTRSAAPRTGSGSHLRVVDCRFKRVCLRWNADTMRKIFLGYEWGQTVLLAYEMNGEVLLPEHGYPLRLIVPGFYGTNSVKWLQRIELPKERAPGPFTTRWYNDVATDGCPVRCGRSLRSR